jgi:hypothetical protein
LCVQKRELEPTQRRSAISVYGVETMMASRLAWAPAIIIGGGGPLRVLHKGEFNETE